MAVADRAVRGDDREALRGRLGRLDRLRGSREFRDVRLSPLAVLARAMCLAVRRTPDVNARWDGDAGEIVVQRYVNLGIAAATPRASHAASARASQRPEAAAR